MKFKKPALPEQKPGRIQCPFCGTEFVGFRYPEIRLPRDRKLKKRLLNRDLFHPVCPSCKEVIKLNVDCLYKDEKTKELFILLDLKNPDSPPLNESPAYFHETLQKEGAFEETPDHPYICRIVSDVDSFREKVLLSESNYDDRIMELVKLSLSRMISENEKKNVYRVFVDETSGNTLQITFILGRMAPYDYVTVKAPVSLYTQCKSKYLSKLGQPWEERYILTNQDWAKSQDFVDDDLIPVFL